MATLKQTLNDIWSDFLLPLLGVIAVIALICAFPFILIGVGEFLSALGHAIISAVGSA